MNQTKPDLVMCLAHGKKPKCDLHFFLNRFRGNLIPVKYISLIPGLLCECHQQKDKYSQVWNLIKTEEILISLKKVLEQIPSCENTTINSSLRSSSLKNLSDQIPQINDTSTPEGKFNNYQISIFRLFYLVRKALEADFTFLNSVLAQNKGDVVKQPPAGDVMEVSFQMPGFCATDIPHLIGRVGHSMKPFLYKHKCYIQLKTGGKDEVQVTVKKKTSDRQLIEKIFADYSKHAKSLKLEIDRRQKAFEVNRSTLYRSRERKIRWRKQGNNVDSIGQASIFKLGNGQAFKEVRKLNYENKVLRHKTDYEISNTKPVKSVLDKGHCLQCLKPYTALTDTNFCKHHPGFIVKTRDSRVWSCCDGPCEEQYQTFDEHTKTGCLETSTHNWRVNKKTAAGTQRQTVRKLNTRVPIFPPGTDSMEALQSIGDV